MANLTHYISILTIRKAPRTEFAWENKNFQQSERNSRLS